MQANFNILFPGDFSLSDFTDLAARAPFSDDVIEFLNDLSVSLLKDRESRRYPDVTTFAFFCRKGNLLRLKERFVSDSGIRLGRGIVFHIAPSNVPVNFGYSLVAGMLAGNNNVVRVSSKDFAQVDIIVRHMREVAKTERHTQIAKGTAVVRYDHASDANALFSSMAAVRVIWGGDRTIETLRKCQLPPRTFDICFADRYSVAAIDPQAVVEASDGEIKALANDFYNDTYLFDQNACSAPHLVLWLRRECLQAAKTRFWEAVHGVCLDKYAFQPVLAVDKLTAFYSQAIRMDIRAENDRDNIVRRVLLKELPANIDDYRCAGGYFGEYTIDDLSQIVPVVTPRYQTLAYFGFTRQQMEDFIRDNHPKGIDRVVPIGHTTDFSLIWDGYDLINTLSRIVTVL